MSPRPGGHDRTAAGRPGETDLAALLGVAGTHAVEQPTALEADWLAGFVTGLEARPVAPGEVPIVPATAPLRPSVRARVDGLLAGVWSRTTAAGASASSDDGSAGVTVLWASQTGTVEEVVETVSARLIAAARTS